MYWTQIIVYWFCWICSIPYYYQYVSDTSLCSYEVHVYVNNAVLLWFKWIVKMWYSFLWWKTSLKGVGPIADKHFAPFNNVVNTPIKKSFFVLNQRVWAKGDFGGFKICWIKIKIHNLFISYKFTATVLEVLTTTSACKPKFLTLQITKILV